MASPQPTPPTTEDVAHWLEWGARKLIAMPAGRLKPADAKAQWPDYVRDNFPGLSDLQTNRIRALAPSAEEITIVDLIIWLPNLCADPNKRRVIHFRAQVHPIRGSHLLTWGWISTKLQIKQHTAKRWYREGLKEIARNVEPERVCRIAAFFSNT